MVSSPNTPLLESVDYFAIPVSLVWFFGGIWLISVTVVRLFYVTPNEVKHPCARDDRHFHIVAPSDDEEPSSNAISKSKIFSRGKLLIRGHMQHPDIVEAKTARSDSPKSTKAIDDSSTKTANQINKDKESAAKDAVELKTEMKTADPMAPKISEIPPTEQPTTASDVKFFNVKTVNMRTAGMKTAEDIKTANNKKDDAASTKSSATTSVSSKKA